MICLLVGGEGEVGCFVLFCGAEDQTQSLTKAREFAFPLSYKNLSFMMVIKLI